MEQPRDNGFRLGFPGSAYLRLGLSSVALTALGYAVLRGLVPHVSFLSEVDWLARPPSTELWRSPLPLVAGALAGAACFLLWLRQPRGARVTWDEEGITEWDGEGVRAAIRWRGAARALLEVRRRRRRTGAVQTVGEVIQIRDPEGRSISVASDSWVPGFMMRRRTVSRRPFIPRRLEPATGIVPDGSRGLRWTVWPLRIGYASLAVAAWGLHETVPGHSDVAFVAWLVLLSALLLCLRSLRPLRELLSLLRVDRSLARAVPVSLVDGEGPILVARDGQGRELRLDVSELRHPDALLHTRRGPAWVDLGGGGPAAEGAYRGGGLSSGLRAIELDGTRRARRSLEVAVSAEAAARLGLALAAAVPGLLLLGLL